MKNSFAIIELAEAQEKRAAMLDLCVDGSIHAAAAVVLRGLALLCEQVEETK